MHPLAVLLLGIDLDSEMSLPLLDRLSNLIHHQLPLFLHARPGGYSTVLVGTVLYWWVQCCLVGTVLYWWVQSCTGGYSTVWWVQYCTGVYSTDGLLLCR